VGIFFSQDMEADPTQANIGLEWATLAIFILPGFLRAGCLRPHDAYTGLSVARIFLLSLRNCFLLASPSCISQKTRDVFLGIPRALNKTDRSATRIEFGGKHAKHSCG
jgi:hypothetical protein